MADNDDKVKLRLAVSEMAALARVADVDAKQLPKLREFIAKHKEVFEMSNLLLGSARSSLTRTLAGHKAGSSEIYLHEVDAMRDRLTEDDDSPLVKLLIERVVMCFLRSCLAELTFTLTIDIGNLSYKNSEYLDKELTRANSRFLRACDSLARVRVMIQAHRAIKAKADTLDAKAAEARMNKSNAAMRLLKSATG